MKKVAFVIGHTAKDGGAFSRLLKTNEFDLFNSLYFELKTLGDVFTHDPKIDSYTKRQTDTSKKTVSYDIVFELHFNASGTGKVQGCEALYFVNSKSGEELAEDFCKIWSLKSGIPNRFAKEIDKGGRGYGFLQKTKGTAVILEPFFGDNFDDCKKWNKERFIDTLKELLI